MAMREHWECMVLSFDVKSRIIQYFQLKETNVKIRDIATGFPALNKLGNSTAVPVLKALQLAKIIKIVKSEYQDYQKVNDGIIKKYGKIMPNSRNFGIMPGDPNWDKYIKDYDKLADQESEYKDCLLYTSPSPRDLSTSRMPSSA